MPGASSRTPLPTNCSATHSMSAPRRFCPPSIDGIRCPSAPLARSLLTVSTHPASTSFTGALATPHSLATEAGMRAYRDGGNAIDAAIVAAAVLTVVYPHNVALGG